MRWLRKRQAITSMPSRFDALAIYNSEVARGIVHTKEWDEQMERQQVDFNEWARHDG